jgi:hydrogenase expression/formation protein HypC
MFVAVRYFLDGFRVRAENRRREDCPSFWGERSDLGEQHPGPRLMCLAVPGQVLEVVDEQNRLARVDVAGVQRNVNIGLLDGDGEGARPGDWVLIHVGFALSKVDEEEAQATLRLLQKLGEAYEQELEDLKASVIE